MENNVGRLRGLLEYKPLFSNESHGNSLFSSEISIKRDSGVIDRIPILIPGKVLDSIELDINVPVEVTGSFRSLSVTDSTGNHLKLYFYCDTIENSNLPEIVNEIELKGYICKEPVLRETPLGKVILDLFMAIPRGNGHRTDYIPCIVWGSLARELSLYKVGTRVKLSGRVQSREYRRSQDNTINTVYEVSISSSELMDVSVSSQNLETNRQHLLRVLGHKSNLELIKCLDESFLDSIICRECRSEHNGCPMEEDDLKCIIKSEDWLDKNYKKGGNW